MQSAQHYGRPEPLTRDEDVLDTWFSSGLWPFSTLGWPERTDALETYYPNSDLITGFDIIFFWVARMAMLGLHFMGDVPFRTVYIHALVRDETGQKMSKSKGQRDRPAGADRQVRRRRAPLHAGGDGGAGPRHQARREPRRRLPQFRHQALERRALLRGERVQARRPASIAAQAAKSRVNRWIVGEAARAAREVTAALDAYRFDAAAGAVYHFTWDVFCDWYLEFSKPTLSGPDGPAKDETRATAAWVLDTILGLLHPFMPFVSEELWGRIDEGRAGTLITAPWPVLDEGIGDPDAAQEMDWVVRLVTAVRAVRAEMNVPAGARIALGLRGAGPETEARLGRHRDVVARLARLSEAELLDGEVPSGSVQMMLDEATIVLPLAGVIEFDKERARLDRELGKVGKERDKLERKLDNQQFLARAPAHVVEEQRGRLDEARRAQARLEAALERIAAS